MANGYAGKILKINLTTKTIGSIDTERYAEFGGGFGIGAAISWDLAVAPGEWDLQDGFDPRNVPSLMTGGVPVYENGTWSWQRLLDMYLDDAGVELFKTRFYGLEGWDVDTGWPNRKTLEELALGNVADLLASRQRLGAGSQPRKPGP